jgi:enoyl-CoA hydratase/carnithine racemase
MQPTLSITGQLATITLNNPDAANRLNPEDLDQLLIHLDTVNQNSEVLALILQAKGKYFCSGFDISSLKEDAEEKSLLFEVIVNAFEDCRPVTIALIQGGVYGGATDMALACDFRVGTEEAEMFMPAAKLGIHFYQRGLERYVSRLGVDTAKRLLLCAEKIQSSEMKELGFLTSLVKKEELEQACKTLTSQLLSMAPLSLLGMKKHLNTIARGCLDIDSLKKDIANAQNSKDLQEGRLAWAEKRRPQFTGR